MADRPLNLRSLSPITGLALALCCAAPLSQAASAVKLTGSLVGTVKDGSGIPQLGATVLLFNRYDKVVEKAITNLRGDFLFDALPSDVYSVRVTMSSFVPALKRNITVLPGMQSVLAINLATLFSSIELVYTGPNNGSLMNDEWKWALRSSMTTRPVLRILPEIEEQGAPQQIFSDTAGMVRVSTGEGNPYSSAYMDQSDLGTAFALATSIYGHNRVQVTGNLGYALEAASPTTGVRATFSRGEGGEESSWPEVKVTMQQAALALRGASQQRNAPVFRTLSLSTMDHTRITSALDLEYGVSFDSIQFYDRLNYLSPYARLNYDLHEYGQIQLGYSSGAPPIELVLDSRDTDASLRQDIVALSLLPRVSVRDGNAHVQRAENFEIGYHFRHGSRSYSVGAYHEYVSNGAVTLFGAGDQEDGLDLLPQIASDGSIFNVGNYSRSGYSASMTQNLGDAYSLTLAWGNGGVLRADGRTLQTDDPSELRSMLRPSQEQWLAGRVNAVVPWLGTRLSASYQWTDARSITPTHIYFTQPSIADPGLNIRVRQPIPPIFGMPGRLEATAELRNLLAQGYLPVQTASGQVLILTQSPRAIRGGLSFIF